MKNKIFALTVVLCLIAALFGCSNTPVTNGTSVPEASSSAVPEKSSSAEPVFDTGAYDGILREYYDNMSAGKLDYDREGYAAISDYIEANGTDNILTEIGYTFRDMNSDGAPELIIAPMHGENTTKGLIYAVFTFKNNNPVLVLTSNYRNSNYLTESGFFHSGSSGAVYYSFSEFTLSKDGTLECVDYYYTHEIDGDMSNIGCFHNKTGDFNGDTDDLTDISLDEFWELEKEYGTKRIDIELVPFAQYK